MINQVCPKCMCWMDWVGERLDVLKCRACGYTYKPSKRIISKKRTLIAYNCTLKPYVKKTAKLYIKETL